MFPLGVFLLALGYAAVYTGVANLRNGGQGPTFLHSLGLNIAVAPPGADEPNTSIMGPAPNLTGQPPGG